MSEPVISVDHVSKRFRVPLDHGHTLQYRFSHPVSSSRYRELQAVNDVSFDIGEGDFIGITGPNGCGKSTLLKMISRIFAPDTGSVMVRGRVSPFIELGVGFKGELSARENVFLAGAVLGLTRAQLATKLDDVLEFAELTEFADQKLKNFSSGMSARLAFSVAMLADADVLLLDEVLAVGDARFREKCLNVFDYYKQEKRTVVLVSHDLATLELYCDRVLLMQRGHLIADGLPQDVTAQYRRLVSKMSETGRGSPASGSGPLARKVTATTRRWGTREVEITDVRLLDDNGNERDSFLTGEPLVVQVDYKSNGLNGRFTCSVGFGRSSVPLLAAPRTSWAPDPLPPVRSGAAGTVTYRLPAVGFLGASYLLSVSLYDERNNHMYDAIQNVMEFRVTDVRGRVGWLALDGEWSHKQAGAGTLDDSGAVA